MAYKSYIRTFRSGKGIAVLSPSRIPVWGLRPVAKDFADPFLLEPTDPRLDMDSSWKRKAAAPITESLIAPPGDKVKSTRKTTDALKTEALFTSHVSAVNPLSASRPRTSDGRKEESASSLQASRSGPAASIVLPIEQTLLTPHVAPLPSRMSRLPRGENRTADYADPEIAEVRPSGPTTTADRPQIPQTRETQNQEVSNLKDAVAVLRGITRASVPTRQANLKPPGNAIHIGSVDIHIHSSASPVIRQVVRPPAPVAPITRGFAPSFGLSQA